ncbi:coiled-coil domain-containing protein 8 [Talpa occidentalis]|uniref:coiled-coil domain-containing protein 8 n=1 Tax=Talpa occidentalis TaxID=50954 RepID=UPI00188F7F22|nr:coiled-coil domain-containing protein 8 [Talpa occidentalis]
MLQIGEDVDYLLIPREVRLAGGVWRVISKPATKEAEFRERLTQFLEEEGRTLEDVARIIEKSTPHPPQPPKKPKEPRVRRRVQQVETPPPRLVVGTYDSSNASDSEFSDFETSGGRGAEGRGGAGRGGAGRGRRPRRMPVSYLGSKFLGSDVESEDDEELVEAFLRRGEKKPNVQPVRRRVPLPVPMFEDSLAPQLSKADRWREYVSQVSWGKLKRRVKGWAPRSGPVVGENRPVPAAVEREGASLPGVASPQNDAGNGVDGRVPEPPPRRWRPKINWASFRRRRKEEATSLAQGADVPPDPGAEAVDNQRAEAMAVQGAEAADNHRVEAVADQGVLDPTVQRADPTDNQREEAIAVQGAEGVDSQRVEAVADQGTETPAVQRPEPVADQGSETPAVQRPEPVADQGSETPAVQRPEPVADQGSETPAVQRPEPVADQGSETPAVQRPDNRREGASTVEGGAAASDGTAAATDRGPGAASHQRAEAPAVQEAEASAAQGVPRAPPGARARKQVKTVRFQTPGRFSWFHKRRRAFWHTPRVPALPRRAPRAGEARSLRVLRAEARAEVEQGEQEDPL